MILGEPDDADISEIDMRDEDFGKVGVAWTVRMKDGSLTDRGGDCGVAGAV